MSLAVTSPAPLLLMLGVLALAALTLLTLRWQERAYARLSAGSGPSLHDGAGSARRRTVKASLLLLALAVLVVGSAGPYAGNRPETLQRQRADIMVVLDVSLSMLAQDVAPSRFEAGRRSIDYLFTNLQGDCAGLAVFGARAALRAPCTLDYQSLRSLLWSASPGSAPLQGSFLAEALRTGLGALRNSQAPLRGILLVTDGEDLGSGVEAVVADLKLAGIPVNILGTGTPQGTTIPVTDPGGAIAPKRDRDGQVVITRLEEQTLRWIAAETGGAYLTATGDPVEALKLYHALRAPQALAPTDIFDIPMAELTRWLAVIAFALLVLEVIIAERRAAGRRRLRLPFAPAALLLLALGPACGTVLSEAYHLNQAGLSAYGEGQFARALVAFRDAQAHLPDAPELAFNAGAALHQQGQDEAAFQEWQHAGEAGDTVLRRNASFNAGNALFLMRRFPDAAEAYRRVLREDPDDFDAKFNLELALRKQAEPPRPEDQPEIPVGTPRTIPLGDADPGPQGQLPQPPMFRTQGQQGPDPMQSQLPPRGGSGPPDAQQPDLEPVDPAEALRRALEQAGEDFTPQESLNILQALRLSAPELQERYSSPPPLPEWRRPVPPERDW